MNEPVEFIQSGHTAVTVLDARLVRAAPALLSALERLRDSYCVMLMGKPVRDADEVLAEVSAALTAARPSHDIRDEDLK